MGMLRCVVTLAPPVPPPLVADFPPFFTFPPVLFALESSLPDLSLFEPSLPDLIPLESPLPALLVFEPSLPDLIPLESPLPALLVLEPSLPDATDSTSLIVDRRGSDTNCWLLITRSIHRSANHTHV